MTSALNTSAMERRFPLNPRLNPPDPFRDTSGQNPFAEQGPDEPINEDPYSSPMAPAVQPYKPGDYEPVLADRSPWILAFGIGGLGLSLLAAVIAISGVAASRDLAEGVIYGIPAALLGLAVSIPGCILGGADSRAIRHGAMPTTRAHARARRISDEYRGSRDRRIGGGRNASRPPGERSFVMPRWIGGCNQPAGSHFHRAQRKSHVTVRGSPDRRPARFGVRWLGTALDFKLAE